MIKIPISKPYLDNNDKQGIINTFDSSWISSNGLNIKLFENKFAKYTGSKYSLSCSNGTIAIELALRSLGVKKNQEIIVPNITYAATINAILNVGALPVILDIQENSFGFNDSELKKNINHNTFAIIFVHLFGIPININKYKFLKKYTNVKIIEDCAESLGAKILNKHCGSFSDCSTFSFFSNKIITTGEGGMINFKKKSNFDLASIIKNQGRDLKKNYWHTTVGGNYRMTNIQASLGITQLQKINILLKLRKKIYELYDQCFKIDKRIIPLHNLFPCNFDDISYWYYTIKINNLSLKNRERLIISLKKFGIETRPMFYPLSDMEVYKKFFKGKNLNAKKISYSSISLPTYPGLKKSEIVHISKTLRKNIK